MTRWAYQSQKGYFVPSDLDDDNVKPLVNELYNTLSGALDNSIGIEIPDKLRGYLDENIFVFSGCKTFEELTEIGALLRDEAGEIKPFYKFYKETREIHRKYNKNHLEAEYIFATQSAEMAAAWADFEKYGDRYHLQYRTAFDDRVRKSHAALHDITLEFNNPFWNKYFPPNGWRCRCTVVQVLKGDYPLTDNDTANDAGEKATFTIGKGGKNTSAMFRFNPGKQKIIFPETHPYFKKSKVVKHLKEQKPPTKKDGAGKSKAIINLDEFIKGESPTNQEIKNILIKYAELSPDDFRRGLESVEFNSSKSYLMAHTMSYNSLTGEWASGSMLKISGYNFGGFNAAKELRGALAAIKKGEPLTFNQEYSVESLWHEIMHAKTKTKRSLMSSRQIASMETVNQFCARHTYDKFLEKLGGKATNKDKILSDGYGYYTEVKNFRQKLKDYGITEKKALDTLMPKLLTDYSTIQGETDKFFKANEKPPKAKKKQ